MARGKNLRKMIKSWICRSQPNQRTQPKEFISGNDNVQQVFQEDKILHDGHLNFKYDPTKELEQRHFILRNAKYVQQVFQDQMIHEITA